jgi:phosphohistidine phosphatase SixA
MRLHSLFRSTPPVRWVLLALLALGSVPTPGAGQSDAVVVYLVRHAERAEDGTNDPPISSEGQARAALVATLLQDAGITHIHTTDFKRTRSTGAPTSEITGLGMELYDPRELAGFAERLRGIPGRHLVLGHSNTTPQMVEVLGGDPGTPIEEMEYDRLYVVTLTEAGASTVMLRFGSLYTN